jgi:hypothetical protein
MIGMPGDGARHGVHAGISGQPPTAPTRYDVVAVQVPSQPPCGAVHDVFTELLDNAPHVGGINVLAFVAQL